MKWKSVAEDYFTFTRMQRRSLLVILGIILTCLIVRFTYSYFFSVQSIPADMAFLQEAARLSQPDTTREGYAGRYNSTSEEKDSYREPDQRLTSKKYNPKGELFPFDPNTLSASGWKQLGLRDKTVATIQNYLSKGGRFRKPEDIRRIYGLYPDEAERLLPYVRIAIVNTQASTDAYVKKENSYLPATRRNDVTAPIDINTADTTAFIALPGIGSKLAGRIVNFREKLGGFYAIDQVGETFGLPDSTFQKIKPRLVISDVSTIKKLNVNISDAAGLKVNPYIRWNVANAIVQYRQQHGSYASLNDLKKIVIIDEQLWEKLVPYLTVQ